MGYNIEDKFSQAKKQGMFARKSGNTLANKTQQVLDNLPNGVRYIGPSALYTYRIIFKSIGKNILLSEQELKLYEETLKHHSTSCAISESGCSHNSSHRQGRDLSQEIIISFFAINLKELHKSDLKHLRYILSKKDFSRAIQLKQSFTKSY